MTPQTNEKIANKAQQIIDYTEACIGDPFKIMEVRRQVYLIVKEALDLKDAEKLAFAKDYAKAVEDKWQIRVDAYEATVATLTAEVGELKKALDHWTLMHIQESARSAKLEANLKIAVEAMETIRGQSPCDYIAWDGRQGCKVHENSHQCLAHDTLSRLKSGGGGS